MSESRTSSGPDMVAAVAVDQDAAQAHGPHLPERDLHRPAVGVRRWCVEQNEACRYRSAAPARIKLSTPWGFGTRVNYCASRCRKSPRINHPFAVGLDTSWGLTCFSLCKLAKSEDSRIRPVAVNAQMISARSQPWGRANREAKQTRPYSHFAPVPARVL